MPEEDEVFEAEEIEQDVEGLIHNHQWQKMHYDHKTLICPKCLITKPNPFNGLQRHVRIKYEPPYY